MNFISRIILGAALLGGAVPGLRAEDLVILHTNDTHSAIEPDAEGKGGFLQRQALIDSVRNAEKNVILVDAGDMVQGSLYFKFWGGDVEYPLFNMAGYDVRILGNHEFDNGMESLAKHYRDVKAARLSANYDFTGTPLQGMFDPYVIREVDGKKIGFIGINVNPDGLISQENYSGMGFKDIIKTADTTARYLKKDKKCDLVVVVSHIGAVKEGDNVTDYDLATASHYIDIIIGGHSHTTISPDNAGKYPSIVHNADRKPVLIAQTGKYGRNLGYIKIDLDKLKKIKADRFDYQLIPVTDRFDRSVFNHEMEAFLAPYRHMVDSINAHVIARSSYDLDNDTRTGGYANFAGDFARLIGQRKVDSLRRAGVTVPDVDFAMMNVGGIRHKMPKGDVTEGQILSTFPFSNHLVLASIKGQDFIDAMKIAARKGGEAVSNEIRVVTDEKGELVRVVLNGEEMDPEREYLYATIDYLFWGNDGFKPLANSKLVWRDAVEVSQPILQYIEELGRLGVPIAPDMAPRFVKQAKL